MKILYFIILISFFSCSKSVEDKCFVDKMNSSEVIIEDKKPEPYSVKQILMEKPAYLEIINLTEYRTFKIDSTEYYTSAQKFKGKYEDGHQIFNQKFYNQFEYLANQQIGNTLYALGMNKLGYWLLVIENDTPSAYFLGLSFNHYYFNRVQENPIIQGGYLMIEGSLVRMADVGGLRGYIGYSAIDDGKLFKIKLVDLMRDRDRDGYNDIFEVSFGLNPDYKDTDGDGINDFEDLNPMFKSEKDKFTELYLMLLPDYGNADLKKMRYTFQVYKSDCHYFHQINPEVRVLFMHEEENKRTYYTKITDVTEEYISKIQKDQNDSDNFYIYKTGDSFKNDYLADYKKGKWTLKVIGGYII